MLTNIQKENVLNAKEEFIKKFKNEPTDYFMSCGRLEIIGNHVDYNGGKVINSSAGNLNIFAATQLNKENKIEIASLGYPKLVVDLNDLTYKKKEEGTSVALIKGIVTQFKELGYKVGGIKISMISTIIKGGGVSSSASYCCIICKILSYYFNNDSLDVITIAKISRWSENNYFGKGSGLQDEIGCCAKNFVITDYKDQNNPVLTNFNSDISDYNILLIDTKTEHGSSQAGYQSIVKEMNEICDYFNVKYLIEIPFDKFLVEFNKGNNKNHRNWTRAYHFLTEVQRVDKAYECLVKNDIKGFLKEFKESGLSSENNLQSILSDGETTNHLYEILHKGRELLKDGAIRVHGGGFGGTTMVWVNKKEEESFKNQMKKEFPFIDFINVYPSSDPLRKINLNELN